jgi:radical SAM protein with 4Fe4S-binding SPASM domain
MYSISDKIDNVTHMTDDFKSLTPPPPIAVKIDLSRTCNYKCSFCFHSQLEDKKGQMDFDLYKRIIDELYSLGIREVAPFFFGESFLNARLPEAIKYAKDVGMEYVFLTTNGSIATPSKVEECFKAGLNSLKFSLNYSDEDQLVEIARVDKRNWFRMKEHIKAAKKIRDEGGYDCGLYASWIMYDGEQQEKMNETLAELKPYLDEVYALPLYNQAAKVNKGGWLFSGGNQGRALNPVDPVPCWALFREAHINYDGTLCACCFSVGEEFNMGDLTKQSFMEAWHSEAFQNLRQAHLNYDVRGTPCENCIIQEVCHGTTEQHT